ncbi:MAG: TrkA C-terminal domain-containing protein [Candidatus Hydrogenedentes bacterium]|nr:TrkA C-terminal domain-containing protein [Candidatus Hydrogenedentota bacterium]
MSGIVALLVVLTVGLLITRIATCALVFTGLSHDLARFQARSAFTGCGFTTREAERIAEHPVRRRIIMILMLMGNGTVVLAITSLIPVVVGLQDSAGEGSGLFYRVLWLALGLLVLWMVASSNWVDRQLFRIIGWALKRFTNLEVRDYVGLLHLSDGFAVNELEVLAGDWLVGKNLIELRLADEGIQVLGIRRADGEYVGTPTGRTYIRNADTVILYGRREHLAELDGRRADESGDRVHEERMEEQQRLLVEQTQSDSRAARDAAEAAKAAKAAEGANEER